MTFVCLMVASLIWVSFGIRSLFGFLIVCGLRLMSLCLTPPICAKFILLCLFVHVHISLLLNAGLALQCLYDALLIKRVQRIR